jgi:ABC-type multidrug transport system fused ATPase/permease subunit
MDRGRIVEQGTHDSLMQLQGLYYHLQTLQNGNM